MRAGAIEKAARAVVDTKGLPEAVQALADALALPPDPGPRGVEEMAEAIQRDLPILDESLTCKSERALVARYILAHAERVAALVGSRCAVEVLENLSAMMPLRDLEALVKRHVSDAMNQGGSTTDNFAPFGSISSTPKPVGTEPPTSPVETAREPIAYAVQSQYDDTKNWRTYGVYSSEGEAEDFREEYTWTAPVRIVPLVAPEADAREDSDV